jgi:hypothetical protein
MESTWVRGFVSHVAACEFIDNSMSTGGGNGGEVLLGEVGEI